MLGVSWCFLLLHGQVRTTKNNRFTHTEISPNLCQSLTSRCEAFSQAHHVVGAGILLKYNDQVSLGCKHPGGGTVGK